MTARIVLVRHGRSAHAIRGWHTVAGVHEWYKGYDEASLVDGDQPPAGLVSIAAEADVIISSDLPRAMRSAALTVPPGVQILVSPLLREVAMPIPDFGRARLPLVAWALAIGLRWVYGRHRGELPSALLLEQARGAVSMLTAQAGEDQTVVAFTHATVRTLIAEELIARGWQRDLARRRYSHWSTWSFNAPSVVIAGHD